jgi:hypothetical protein
MMAMGGSFLFACILRRGQGLSIASLPTAIAARATQAIATLSSFFQKLLPARRICRDAPGSARVALPAMRWTCWYCTLQLVALAGAIATRRTSLARVCTRRPDCPGHGATPRQRPILQTLSSMAGQKTLAFVYNVGYFVS